MRTVATITRRAACTGLEHFVTGPGVRTDYMLSFDVFDTVLTRLVGDPRQVFVETGRRLLAAHLVMVSAEAYAATREQVMAELTDDIRRHPSLRQISEEVAERLGLDPASADTVYETELAVERDVCRAVPGMARALADERRGSGQGVVFVSDTPLPVAFVQSLLEREGLFGAADRVYTSSGCGESKQHGDLFDVVRRDLNSPPQSFLHTGDDEEADVVNARLHGWRARSQTRARVNAAERRLDDRAAMTDGLGTRLAGAARMGRLTAVADGADPTASAIGADIAMPLMVAFGLWVLSQARRRGIDRLYFVARDGEILLRVTQALATALGDSVECRYLYGSRRVWQLAARGTVEHQGAELWLPDEVPGAERTVAEVLELVGITADEAFELTGKSVFSPSAPSAPLGDSGFVTVRDELAQEPLASRCRARARERHELLIGYLDQEGVTGPGTTAIVDVGWTGRASKALEDVLDDAGRPRPAAHLFIGLKDNAPDVMGQDLYSRSHGWLVDEPAGRRLQLEPDEDLVMLVETFTMGSEGSTTGYQDIDGVITAQLAVPANPVVKHWRFEDYRAALGHAVDALTEMDLPGVAADLRPLVVGQILGLWRRPSPAQARVWGAQPYGEDFYNIRWHPLATPLTSRRLLTRLGIGRAQWREPTYWLAGSVAMSREPWRFLLATAMRYRHLPARLRRVPGRLRAEVLRRRS